MLITGVLCRILVLFTPTFNYKRAYKSARYRASAPIALPLWPPHLYKLIGDETRIPPLRSLRRRMLLVAVVNTLI
jgi:hypothetical protein